MNTTTMPSTFTDEIAEDLLREYGRNMMALTVILPGASAINSLNHALRRKAAGQALLLPKIQGMDDFINSRAGIRRAGTEVSLLHLFHAFRKCHHPEETLAGFLPLGQQLLSDFDVILRAGRKPSEVFAGMKQWESAGAGFADFMDEEQKQLMRNFSGLFHDDLAGKRTRFLKLWESLPEVFQAFETSMLSAGLGTAGMLYREATQRIRQISSGDNHQFYFAGFSSLSVLETCFMEGLAEKGLASFAWDLMPEFHQRKEHEVKTIFQRLESVPAFRPSLQKWLERCQPATKPLVRQVQCPGMSGMAQWMLATDFPADESTAFIVSDPAMIQLLEGRGKLPNGKSIRFSMGYPMDFTPFARWLFRIFSWISREDKNHCRPFFPVFEDPHFRLFFPEAGQLAMQLFKASEKPELADICSLPGLPGWLLAGTAPDFFQDFGSWIRGQCSLPQENIFLSSSLQATSGIFEELRESVRLAGKELTFQVLQTFLHQRLKACPLVSVHERDESVEAMGLFESRLLDFRRIVIFPGEEGLFPVASSQQTMLPESVRRAFGLPLRAMQGEEQAWQFYRLCKRSSEVIFLVSDSGERRRSRFLDQIELEKLFPFQLEAMKFGYSHYPAPAISLQRNQTEMQRAQQFFASGNDMPERKFSPTSMHALITCPLRFHYQKIRGLKEPEVFSQTEMSALDFGKWLHGSIQFLIEEKGKDGHFLLPGDYKAMETAWDATAAEIWRITPDKTSLGNLRDFPIEQALGKILAERFFAFMKKHRPHRWLANEYDFPDLHIRSEQYTWLLGGRADIVLEEEDCFRFLDLKTGAFQNKNKLLLKWNGDGEPDTAKMVEQKDYFQMLCYNRMAAADPAFHRKKQFASLFYLANPQPELASPLEKIIAENGEAEFYHQFDEILIRHLEEFSSANAVIQQTQDAKNCSYCAYNAMCRR